MAKGKSVVGTIFKWIGIVLAVIVAVILVFVIVMTIAEYNPKPVESITLEGNGDKTVEAGVPFTIMSWNTGYGALGDDADFFMDGGTRMMTCTKERVYQNVEGLIACIKDVNPDFLFLQEVDKKAKRSYKINENEIYKDAFSDYQSSFATNFKVLHVPYPLFDNIGQVDCGIVTFSSVNANEASRIQLPCPFKYPIRMFNLKRCLLINRIPVSGSDKELVLVNLHLEAYDSGEGKIAQTKMLRDIFDEEVAKGNYVIAGGDFNQTFSSVDISAYPCYEGMWLPGIIETSDFADGVQLMMDNREPSCRSLDKVYKDADLSKFQFYVIDGFIVSPNITINSFETKNFNFENTDHNPVVMNVTLQ